MQYGNSDGYDCVCVCAVKKIGIVVWVDDSIDTWKNNFHHQKTFLMELSNNFIQH